MGRRKRTLELDGGAAVSRGRPKQPVRDLDLEGTADPGEMGIIGGNSYEGRADGDPPMEETEGAGIVGDDSGEGRDRPAYFMACHWDWAGHPKPFSVYKVDAAGLSDASSTPSPVSRQRLRRVTRLDTGAGGVVGKSFVSVRSKQRAWIVGVGGRAGETIIFDTDTHAVIHGPGLKSAKHCPVLAAVGDRVYALCKSPSWVSDPDFPPWFEVLDLSQARVVTVAGRFHLEGCSWSDLPYPPCLPWKLSLADYTRATMPMVITTSSVVVGSYILVSFDKQWGTHAFDTILCEWHKVHDDPLPFAGCPATYGGSVYLGVSKRNGPGPISGYHIRVTPSGKDLAPKLSITVLPVNYEGHGVDSGDRFCSLGNGRFCSLSFVLRRFIRNPVTKYRVPRKAHLNLRTYQVDPSLLATLGESLDVNQEIAFTSQLEQDYKICSSSHGFSPYAFALLSI